VIYSACSAGAAGRHRLRGLLVGPRTRSNRRSFRRTAERV